MDGPDLEPTIPAPGELAPELGTPMGMRLALRINGGPWRDLGTLEDVREGRGNWPAS